MTKTGIAHGELTHAIHMMRRYVTEAYLR